MTLAHTLDIQGLINALQRQYLSLFHLEQNSQWRPSHSLAQKKMSREASSKTRFLDCVIYTFYVHMTMVSLLTHRNN
jgi:hypothetical protein